MRGRRRSRGEITSGISRPHLEFPLSFFMLCWLFQSERKNECSGNLRTPRGYRKWSNLSARAGALIIQLCAFAWAKPVRGSIRIICSSFWMTVASRSWRVFEHMSWLRSRNSRQIQESIKNLFKKSSSVAVTETSHHTVTSHLDFDSRKSYIA